MHTKTGNTYNWRKIYVESVKVKSKYQYWLWISIVLLTQSLAIKAYLYGKGNKLKVNVVIYIVYWQYIDWSILIKILYNMW